MRWHSRGGNKENGEGKQRFGRRFWLNTAGAVIVLAIVIFGLVPEAVRLGIERWLDSRSRISAEVEDVDFNLFTGSMAVKALLAQREGTGGLLEWNRASFSIEWWPLTRKRIRLDDIILRDATVTLRRRNGTWYVGGLKFRPSGGEGKKTGWEFGAGRIDLKNVRIVFTQGGKSREVVVNGHLDPMQPWSPEKTSGFDLRIASEDWTILFDGDAEPFSPSHPVQGRLVTDKISLAWFAPLFPKGQPPPQGTVQTDTDLFVRMPQGAPLQLEQSGSLSLNSVTVSTPAYRLNNTSLLWNGKSRLFLPKGESPLRISVQGRLSSPLLNVAAADPPVALSASDLIVDPELEVGTDEVPEGASFLLRGRMSAAKLKAAEGGSDTDLLNLAGLQMQGIRVEGADRIIAEVVKLKGLSGQIVRNEKGILEVPGEAKKKKKEGENAGEQKEGKAVPLFRIGLLEIGRGSRLTYVDRSVSPVSKLAIDPLEVRIENVGNITPEEREAPSAIRIRAAVNGRDVSFEGSASPFAGERSMEGRLRLQAFPLDWIKPFVGLKEFAGIATFLSADTRVAIRLPSGGKHFSMVQKGAISADGIAGAFTGYQVNDSALNWNGSLGISVAEGGKKPGISARGKLNAPRLEVLASDFGLGLRAQDTTVRMDVETGTDAVPEGAGFIFDGGVSSGPLRLRQGGKKTDLLSVEGLEMEGMRLIGTRRVIADLIRILGPRFAEREAEGGEAKEEPSHLFSAESLSLQKVLLRGREWFEAQEISLQGASGFFVRNEQGKMEFPELSFKKKGERGKESAAPQRKEGKLEFGIGRLDIGGGSRFLFIDRSVTPHVHLEMNPLKVSIGNLDSTHSQMKSPVRIDTRFGRFSDLNIKGTVETFTPKRTMHLNAEMNGFNLPRVTGYTERFIGYRVRSGDLNIKAEMGVEKGELDAQIHLTLVKLKLDALEKSEIQEKVANELGFPLNMGLSLLRGKDDRIELDFPVSGSLVKPEIGLANVFRRPILKAVRTAVLGYLSPIGAAAMLGKKLIFDRAVALRFDPALFLPGESELIPDMEEYLNRVAHRLEDRSEAAIVLCGVVTEGDIASLREENPSAEELLALARLRSEKVKAFLISRGIEAGRLVLCAPKVDDDPVGRPRVEIGI